MTIPVIRSEFTTLQVAHEAGVTFRQLDNWVRRGYVKPNASAKYHDRDWPEDEQFVVEEMARLITAGLTVESAAALARMHVEQPSSDGKYLLALGVTIQIE